MVAVGVIGATGFIGSRAIEILAASGDTEVYPIVRNEKKSLSLPCSQQNCRIANALDQSALANAMQGCDVVVHSVTGSPGLIRGTISRTYNAAQQAKVKRLIYMSTMCVHGQAPAPGTTEETPLDKSQQAFPYNVAKIDAENLLIKLRDRGSVEVVIFRPGIVFGPRSPRIIEIANQLLSGSAYLVEGGRGICNTTYIDNLIHAVRLAINADCVDRQAFFIGENEQVTWAEFYSALAESIGVNSEQIPSVSKPESFSQSSKQSLVSSVRDSVFVQSTLAAIPNEVKDNLKNQLKRALGKKSAPASASTQEVKAKQEISVTQEMALLHLSSYKLSHTKAERMLNYSPVFSISDAYKHTADWLLTNGYSAH